MVVVVVAFGLFSIYLFIVYWHVWYFLVALCRVFCADVVCSLEWFLTRRSEPQEADRKGPFKRKYRFSADEVFLTELSSCRCFDRLSHIDVYALCTYVSTGLNIYFGRRP